MPFPFPSNGKTLTKIRQKKRACIGLRCFHSLHTGKHIQSQSLMVKIPKTSKCSHSLQTGRRIHSYDALTNMTRAAMDEFPFPSYGKMDRKEFCITFSEDIVVFPFPSNGKVEHKEMEEDTLVAPANQFQFPIRPVNRIWNIDIGYHFF